MTNRSHIEFRRIRIIAGAICILGTLFSIVETHAQQTETVQSVVQLFNSGEISEAITLLTEALSEVDFDSSPSDAWGGVEALYQLCLAPGVPGYTLAYDLRCLTSAYQFATKLPLVPGMEDILQPRKDYFIALSYVAAADKNEIRELFARKLLESNENPADVSYYIDRQLLAAEAHLFLDDPKKARAAVEKALSTLLAIENGQVKSLKVAQWFMGTINIYMNLNDIRMAQGLFAVTSSYIGLATQNSVADFLTYLYLGAQLNFQAPLPDLALQYSNQILNVTKQIDITNTRYEFMRDTAYAFKIALCMTYGPSECQEELMSDSVLNARVSFTLDNPRDEVRYSMLELIAARAIFLAVTKQQIPPHEMEATRELFREHLPNLSEHRQFVALLRFTDGIYSLVEEDQQLARDKIDEAVEVFVEEFRLASRFSIGHVPVPDSATLIAWAIALATGTGIDMPPGEARKTALASGIRVADDKKALVVAMASGLQISSLEMEGDALALLAAADTKTERRAAHTYLRTVSRQRKAYINLAHSLVQQIFSDSQEAQDSTSQTLKYRYNTRSYAIEFASRRFGLIDKFAATFAKSSPFPGLDEIQEYLDANEALILDSTIGGARLVVCVRNDAVFLGGVPIEDPVQLQIDLKLLRLALEGAHAPDPSLDRQFPVQSAMRLYSVFLGPADNCLKKNDTVYVAARSDGFPWEILLREEPNRFEDGWDLSTARWALQDYSFSYIGTASEFVAMKKLGPKANSSGRFLGVGDPVLSGKTADGIDRVAAITRGVAFEQDLTLAELAELPESATELTEIVSIFGDRGHLLTRTDATEIALRKADSADHEYLTFATHGLVTNEIANLQEPALVFTPVDTGNPLNDGLWTASEIADSQLSARVVSLSACNTSTIDTDLVRAEMQSLSGAFAVAGVPSTIATTAPVNSKSVALINQDTFRRLEQSHLSVAEALRAAKLAFVSHPPEIAYAHPRFWAPIIALGNSKTSASPNNPKLVLTHEFVLSYGGAEVLNVAAVPGEDTVLARFIGDPTYSEEANGEVFQSFIAEFSTVGTERWRWFKDRSGNSATLISSPNAVFAGGSFVKEFDHSTGYIAASAAEIYSLSPEDGRLKFATELDKGSGVRDVTAIITMTDGNVAALVRQDNFSDVDAPSILDIVIIDQFGNVIRRNRLLETEQNLYMGQIYLQQVQDSLAVAYTDQVRHSEARPYFDEFDSMRSCYFRNDTKILFIDPQSLRVKASATAPGRRLSNLYVDRNKNLILIGQTDDECSTRGQAFIAKYEDGKISDQYRDPFSETSNARSMSQLRSGAYILVGSANRHVDSHMPKEFDIEHFDADSLSTMDIGVERFVSTEVMEGLIVRLDQDFQEVDRYWKQDGVDVSFSTVAPLKDGLVVGGLKGSQGWIGTFEIKSD